MAHVNINSHRNKSGWLTKSVNEYIDKLLISETKLDNTCSISSKRLFKSILD